MYLFDDEDEELPIDSVLASLLAQAITYAERESGGLYLTENQFDLLTSSCRGITAEQIEKLAAMLNNRDITIVNDIDARRYDALCADAANVHRRIGMLEQMRQVPAYDRDKRKVLEAGGGYVYLACVLGHAPFSTGDYGVYLKAFSSRMRQYKIGKTKQLEKRTSRLRKDGVEIESTYLTMVPSRLEQWLHSHFGSFRVKRSNRMKGQRHYAAGERFALPKWEEQDFQMICSEIEMRVTSIAVLRLELDAVRREADARRVLRTMTRP